MDKIFNKNVFLVKEHVGMFKAANNFDVYDPQSEQIIMECREDNLGIFTKFFRFTGYKRFTPFNIKIRTKEGKQILRVERGVAFFISKVTVYDENDQPIGGFKQKFFSLGGAFNILDQAENVMCTLKGKWTGWDFQFLKEENELAHVSKKWAGIGKELFTSADNYVIEINKSVPENDPVRELIVAAVFCIDMVLKE